MRIISMTEDTVNRHITAVHDLFVQFDAQQSGALNSIEIGNMIRSTISSDVTNNEVDLFVNALDYDATGAVHFNDLLKFFLKGLNLNRTKRMQFASRSEFHGKLNLFMEYILDREAEMENV
jgi:Ca2+-binding EF-hand superfamily protein